VGNFGYTPTADTEIVELMIIKLIQFTDGLVDGFPTAVFGDDILKPHDRFSFIDTCLFDKNSVGT
jgi:hypothetical protein